MLTGKVEVIETINGMTRVEVTIDDSYDMLKFFHAGMKAGESIWTRQN
jgi:hypothetical protein